MASPKYHTDEERYKFLKYQGIKLKKYLSQFWMSGLFDAVIDSLMDDQERNREEFNNRWNG